jgi:WD40 repeat protein
MVEYEDGKPRQPLEMHMDHQVYALSDELLIIVDTSSILVLEGHTNCIWSLAVPLTQQPLLASAAADGTVKIWDTRLYSRSPLRASVKYAHEDGATTKVNPTCVSWDWEGRGVIIGWENTALELWDVERGVPTMKLISNDPHGSNRCRSDANLESDKSSQVNCFVKHPTDNIIIAGYEDRNIRIFDTRIGLSVLIGSNTYRRMYKFMDSSFGQHFFSCHFT